MLAIADSPHGSAYPAGGSHSSVPGVTRRTRSNLRNHRRASSLAASLDERYVAQEPFLVTDRPSKREPSEIPFAGSLPNEITRFILHLKGSCDKKGVDDPQSLVDLFELLHADGSRHPSPYLATLPEPSNRVSISLEARAVDGVDARQEARVPGFEGSIADPQDLVEAGDDLGLGVDRGASPSPRVMRTVTAAITTRSAAAAAATHTARWEGPRDGGGGGAGWSWNCMVSLVVRAGW
jgi:hypothetical protein